MRIVGIMSGYYNPLTAAHVQSFYAAKKIVDYLIVLVNNDKQVELKDSIPFHDENTRLIIIDSLKPIDSAILSKDNTLTMANTIEYVAASQYKHGDIFIFMNGGDRHEPSKEELEICKDYDIMTMYGVGGYDKIQSSSAHIKAAAEEYIRRNISKNEQN